MNPRATASAELECPVCSARDADADLLHKNGYRLKGCPCGARYLSPPPSVEELTALYSDARYYASDDAGMGYGDYAADEAGRRRTARARLTSIRRQVPPPARLLEVGAAYGSFLAEARAMGYHTTGVEMSPAAEAHLAQNSDEHWIGDIKDAPLNEQYDVVALFDTLEHVPDPQPLIQHLARLLRPGGLMALTTPDAGGLIARAMGRHWFSYRFPEHVVLFDRSALRRLIAPAFETATIRPDSQWIGSGALWNRIRGRPNGPTRGPTLRIPNGNMFVLAKRSYETSRANQS